MNTNPTSFMGKQPPHSIENEIALLGALILDCDRIGDVSAVISSDDFYLDKHREIYNALISLSARSSGIDVVTLLSELVKTEFIPKSKAPSTSVIWQKVCPRFPILWTTPRSCTRRRF